MAQYTVANLRDDLVRTGHGASLDKVKNVYSMIHTAARQLISDIDPRETKRIADLSELVHNDVYDYALQSDVKSIIDIRPQVSREEAQRLSHLYGLGFDLKKELESGRETFHIRHDDGVMSLRTSLRLNPSPKTIDDVNGLTDNGSWAVSGDATNLTEDNTTYVTGKSSLNFDLNASGSSGVLTNSTLTQVDLSTHDEQSSIFVWMYFPDASIITSVDLRWGNDASNYWSRTKTAPHDATAFKNGWNLIEFDWNGATETGTVAPATIDYIRIAVAYNGTAETDIRVDKIFSSLGQLWEIEYYSNQLFRSSAGAWKAAPTDDSDIVNLAEESYNLLLDQCGVVMAQQLSGESASSDIKFFEERYDKNKDSYNWRFPSEALTVQDFYYDI